jgi:hypothetical protein
VPVNHRPRIHGVSKYGLGRAFRVVLDLLTMKMLSTFSRSPLTYFALLASPFVLLPVAYLMVSAWTFGSVEFSSSWGQAALLTFILVSMAGLYFLMLGLLAELVVKVSGRPLDPLVQRMNP